MKGKAKTYLISEGLATEANFDERSKEILKLFELAVAQNISYIQVREKGLPAGLLLRLASQASAITKNSSTKLLINDRADIALASGADGVHLRADSIPASSIRSSFPSGFLIAVSAHDTSEILDARKDGADFVVFGPVFSKRAVGIEALKIAVESAEGFPVFALGGIEASNIDSVLATGAAGIAAIRFLNDKKNLRGLEL